MDEIRMPAEDHDPERARALCAEIARNALRDFAPVSMLLGAALRARCQALAGFTVALFDFARQTGLEGERLSQLNRWGFNLELALDGEPPGQPVFVAMAGEERRRPWPREGLDAIVDAARGLATAPPASAGEAAAGAERLAAALGLALTGEAPGEDLARLGGALFRTRALQDVEEGLRRGTLLLPGLAGAPAAGPELEAAVRAETAALRRALSIDLAGLSKPPAPLPAGSSAGAPASARESRELRRALRYLRATALALLDAIERSPVPPPSARGARLGLGRRLLLLLRARLGW